MEASYLNTYWRTKFPCLIIGMHRRDMALATPEDSEIIPWEIINKVDDYRFNDFTSPFSVYIILWLNNPYAIPVEQLHRCFEQIFITEDEYEEALNKFITLK